MKFRNHKTGDTYDSMARTPCPHDGDCGACKYKPFVGEFCANYCRKHPIEAARMMGFEVVEDQEEAMEKTDKPRICEVLGGKDNPLEVGEQFGISTMPGVVFWICKDGTFDTCPGNVRKSAYHFLRAVDHPDRIIRKPRFTPEEVAAAKMLLGAGAVSVYKDVHGALRWKSGENVDSLRNMLPAKLFPSLRPGQAVRLSDIVGNMP